MTNSREKGKRGEREVRDVLRAFGITARRGTQFRGGSEEADVVHEIAGVHLEVKFCETETLKKWLEQAERDAGALELPVVVFRRSRQPWRAYMRLYTLLERLGVDAYGRAPDVPLTMLFEDFLQTLGYERKE